MAVYSQFNPATGQFEYFQGAPAAPQSGGDPASWNYAYWGQADPRAYPDYWARPDGSLLADAVRMGNAWTAPQMRQLPAYLPPDDVSARYYGQSQFTGAAGEGGGGGSWGGVGEAAGPGMPGAAARAALAGISGPVGALMDAGGVGDMLAGAAPVAARALQNTVDMYGSYARNAANAGRWLANTGRRAAEAQDAAEDWIAGIR